MHRVFEHCPVGPRIDLPTASGHHSCRPLGDEDSEKRPGEACCLCLDLMECQLPGGHKEQWRFVNSIAVTHSLLRDGDGKQREATSPGS